MNNMNNRGQFLAWLSLVLFFVISYTVVFLIVASSDVTVGESRGRLLLAADRLQWERFLLEEQLKQDAYAVLVAQGKQGGYFHGCETVSDGESGVVTVYGRNCSFAAETLLEAFHARLAEESGYDERLRASFANDGMTIAVDMPEAAVAVDGVTLAAALPLRFRIDWFFEDYGEALAYALERLPCVRSTPFDPLFDDAEKIRQNCGFSEAWRVVKSSSHAFFISKGRAFPIDETLELRFAIPFS